MRERLAPVGGDGSDGDDAGLGWEEQLAPYVRNRGLYSCPSYPKQIEFAYFINTRIAYTDYGMTCIAFTYLDDASTFVLLADCSEERMFAPDIGTAPVSWDTCDKDNMTWPCLRYEDTYHGNGSNVCFADGHVKFATSLDPARMTLDPAGMSDWR